MGIHINNECKICGRKFMHDPYKPQVCDDCLKQSCEIEEYMDETGDWKGVMKRVREMEANFLLSNASRQRPLPAGEDSLNQNQASSG